MNRAFFEKEIIRVFEKINKLSNTFDSNEIKEIIDGNINYPIELIEGIRTNHLEYKEIYNKLIINLIKKIYMDKLSLDNLEDLRLMSQIQTFTKTTNRDKKKASYRHFIIFLMKNYHLLAKKQSIKINQNIIDEPIQGEKEKDLDIDVDPDIDSDIDSDVDLYEDEEENNDNDDNDNDVNEDVNEDDNEDEEKDNPDEPTLLIDIFDDIESMSLPEYKKHHHQVETINQLIKTNFTSGIISMIMGAGKSFIILNSIQEHWNIYKKQISNPGFTYPIYMICTDRTEILRSLFFKNISTMVKNKYLEEYKLAYPKSKLTNVFETQKFHRSYTESLGLISLDYYTTTYQNETYSWDLEKFAIWKKNNIIDMEEFELIENFMNKEFKIDLINKSSKPIIYIVNNDFLKYNVKYKQIDTTKLKLVLNDESHGISGINNYNMLKYFRTNGVNVIGLSATPCRDGKKAKQHILDVYGIEQHQQINPPDPVNPINPVNPTNQFKSSNLVITQTNINHKKLNIIYNYDMIQALEDGIVLPFYHVVVRPTVLNKKILLDSTNKEEVSMRTILEHYLINNPELPYHKAIAWVKNISHIQNTGIYYSYVTEIVDKKYSVYRSHSGNSEVKAIDEFGKFEMEDTNSVLLCVNRGKEGSDIRHLDMGLFLDAVKSRSITVSLQTFGRVMRPDKEKKKKMGYIVECVKIDENKSVEMLSVKKVLNYYKMILNLSSLTESVDYYDKIIKLFANTEFDDSSKEVIFKLGQIETKIKLDIMISDWSKLKEFLSNEICQKLKMTKAQLFEKYIKIIKEQEGFNNPNSNFPKLYSKLNHTELGLPKNIYKEFKEFWDQYTWYDVLGFTDFINLKKFYNWCKINSIDSTKKLQTHIKNSNDCRNIPLYPDEYYRYKGWKGWGKIAINQKFF